MYCPFNVTYAFYFHTYCLFNNTYFFINLTYDLGWKLRVQRQKLECRTIGCVLENGKPRFSPSLSFNSISALFSCRQVFHEGGFLQPVLRVQILLLREKKRGNE
jgi:hypothetical protein